MSHDPRYHARKNLANYYIRKGKKTADDYDDQWFSKRRKHPIPDRFKNTPEEKQNYANRLSQMKQKIKEGTYTREDYDDDLYLKPKAKFTSTKEHRTQGNPLRFRKSRAIRSIREGKTTRADYDDDWFKIRRTQPDKPDFSRYCRMRHAQKGIRQGKYTCEDFDDDWYLKKGHLVKKTGATGKPPKKTKLKIIGEISLWQLLSLDDPNIIEPPIGFRDCD